MVKKARILTTVSCLLCRSRKDEEDVDLEYAVARGAAAAIAYNENTKNNKLHTASTSTKRKSRDDKDCESRPPPLQQIIVPNRRRSSLGTSESHPPEQEIKRIPSIRKSYPIDETKEKQPSENIHGHWNQTKLVQTQVLHEHREQQEYRPYSDHDDMESLCESTHRQSKEAARRRSKRFTNIHPAQAKIKAKMDIFEGRRASLDRVPTDLTESETLDSHEDAQIALWRDYRRRSSLLPPPMAKVKDVANDPYEYAYKIWYEKGLLAFRPKSMPDPNQK